MDLEELEESITVNRHALSLYPPDHPHCSTFLDNLAYALWTRYALLGKIEDLEECVSLNREVTVCTPDHPDHSDNHATDHGGESAKTEDLEESISSSRDELVLCPPGHPDRLKILNQLADALSHRYELSGKLEDLEEGISLNREALTLCPSDHPDRSTILNNLAQVLRSRYEQLGCMEDLEESVLLNRDALTLCPPTHPHHFIFLNNLAYALWTRYKQLGRMHDLEEAILLNRRALFLCPPGHPDRPTSFSSLASTLSSRYEQLGLVKDLEESISLNRDALAVCLHGHPHRSTLFNNLAHVLWTRYKRLNEMEDLEESISLNREAVRLRPPGDPNRSRSISSLASTISTRYRQTGNLEDLEECISLNRHALDLYSLGHPNRPNSLVNLAIDMIVRYEHLGRMEDLEEGISLNRLALALCPSDHPHQPTFFSNLARALSIRFEHQGNVDDLEGSIFLYRQALTLRQPGYALHAESLNNLANTILIRYRVLQKTEDVQEMFAYYENAANDPTSYLKDRLVAAIKWSQIARNYDHHSTLNAYTIALQLLQSSLISHPDVKAQHRFLSTASTLTRSLASDAASAAIQAGNLELAVEFLEQGRAMLWSKIGAYQSPLEELRQVQGGEELANQLEKLSARLEHLVLLFDQTTLDEKWASIGASGLSLDARIKQHRILSEQWEDLVERIRKLPGFTHFLLTPRFNTLQSVAAEGPVILINISDYRSDAIILISNNPPILVALSTLATAVLRQQEKRLTDDSSIIRVLRYLWDIIVSPVVDRLLQFGVAKRSRIWWCPTAQLCFLPLHAAGPYRRHEKILPDIYTSSYTSTLSALIKARSSAVQLTGPRKLLVVAQSRETLRHVVEEASVIKQYSHASVQVDVLSGPEANHETVLDSLKHHPWVHLACHSHLGDNHQPFQASIELYEDRSLTLLQLIQARVPNAEFAFLAACHSAGMGDSRTPDENIHISAALQFCGFRSVVGTLWEMFDDDGPMIAKEFYRYMFRNPERIDFRDSAYALNSAIREMRKAKLPPDHWVMFVHNGA